MADVRLMPLAGINNVAEDAALQRGGDTPRLHVRDAVNADITPAGKMVVRPGLRQVSASGYRNLWQSPLHRDVFGSLGDAWVRIDVADWSYTPLVTLGEGSASHIVLNNWVCVAGREGIFSFDGSKAQRLTLETPASPYATIHGEGALTAGRYGVAVSWMRNSMESALSPMTHIDVPPGAALEIVLPMCFDVSVTGARLYLTQPNGGELARAGDYALDVPAIPIPLLPQLGAVAAFRFLTAMPTGNILKYWRGRLLIAKANVLRFSEALAYHLHDERHGFVQLPQRITFVEPVDGGIWVGQVDHVIFLQGTAPGDLTVIRKTARAPVPGSALSVDADTMGGELSSGAGATVLWLAENGYVVGTASGAVVELHAGVMRGITAHKGSTVLVNRRAFSAVS